MNSDPSISRNVIQCLSDLGLQRKGAQILNLITDPLGGLKLGWKIPHHRPDQPVLIRGPIKEVYYMDTSPSQAEWRSMKMTHFSVLAVELIFTINIYWNVNALKMQFKTTYVTV